MWLKAIQAELNSLEKCEVFGLVVQTPEGVVSIGYKQVCVRKHNEKNEIMKYKAQLVDAISYAPVMDAISFRFFIRLVVTEN